MIDKPKIIEGGKFVDHRGSMRFVNDFSFVGVKRFYFIKHPDIDFVRAWQGHKNECKYFYVIKGSFIIAWVKIDNIKSPSMDLKPDFAVFNDTKSQLLYLPKGYANGLKALEEDSEVLIFSDMELEQSVKEKIRYDSHLWFNWDKQKPL